MTALHQGKKVLLFEGTVIPAHPLALTEHRKLDEYYQRLLTRYYLASGAGGIAIGVHTTQFEIRDPKHNLYECVLELAADEIAMAQLDRPFLKIAGVAGNTQQAVREAKIARRYGYDLVLLSNNALGDLTEEELLERAESVGKVMPIFGFYLQPSVGGRVLSFDFWKKFSEIPAVHAIKMAPFNRYQTLDVVRAVCLSSRCNEIALYTGNDDNIVLDLLSEYAINTPQGVVKKEIVGGLLGHWAVWTSKAVSLLKKVKEIKKNKNTVPYELLTEAIKVTDTNAVLFDAANSFKGCIAGLHEVLVRQGLMKGRWCLNDEEKLSPNQIACIDRIYQEYPDLNDDDFVRKNIDAWKIGIKTKSDDISR